MSSLEEIKDKLNAYKRKYYVRQTIIGAISFLALILSLFLVFGYVEHLLWMSSLGRSILFFAFIVIAAGSLYLFILQPLSILINFRKGINDEVAAKDISRFFPEIQDKLLNVLQLGNQNNHENALVAAAIDKKAAEFKPIAFVHAVDFSTTRKYVLILSAVFVCLFLVSFISPEIIRDSPKRIANFDKEFERKAPFSYQIKSGELKAFKGEDYTLEFQVVGEAIPAIVYINVDNKGRIPVVKFGMDTYSYTFNNIQSNKNFQLEAGGFFSKLYEITVMERPDLLSMKISTQNPDYTGGERRIISNTGDLTILEGTIVTWEIAALATEKATILLNNDTLTLNRVNEDEFIIEKRLFESGSYQVQLLNPFSINKSDLSYSINVIQDEFPKITAEFFPDSASYEYITFAGSISDDYGFSDLSLHYKSKNAKRYTRIPLEINKSVKTQSYYANWSLDTLNLQAGSSIELYVTVSDNDRINGFKQASSQRFILQVPTEAEIDALIAAKSDEVENTLDDAKQDAESIAEKLSEVEKRLKSEQKFDWQEKKLLEDVIEDREELNKQIEELQKKHEELQKSNQQFKKQSNQLQQKNEQMQELLDQLMDEETRALYEKLKELMKENASQDEVSQQIQDLKRSEQNLERDLERALELFKRLKMESALEQNLQTLDTLSNQQENAANKNKEGQSMEEAKQEQQAIEEEFEEFRKKMDQVLQMNQELKRPEALEDFEYEERQIAKELREIMEEMKEMEGDPSEQSSGQEQNNAQESQQPSEQNNNEQKKQEKRKQIQQKQQGASQKMKSLSQKLNKMQGGMQMEMMQANLDQLRDILDNLVKLSFNQEDLLKEMRTVDQSDPRFLELSQNQLKLKDDAKVIQDSLLSLAEKVVQISSYVTKEVGKINQNIDESLDYLKDRNRNRALTSQQFTMTSINNLALLLDDTMQQMQMAMAESMGTSQDKKQKSQGLPDLQELQNKLGEKMNELKGSGKSGRELSEELARLAAEQEMIRQRLEMIKEMEDGRPGGKGMGDDLQQAIEMMEKNEIDLVNKRLTQQLINRQKQIQTRLLEAEKAQREQEMEEEREADRPSVISREIPPEFEEYLKLKKKEIELLKTIPAELTPFYKKEVNDYFRRLSTEDQND